MNDNTTPTASKINEGQGITIPVLNHATSDVSVPLIYDGRRAYLHLKYTESESGYSFAFQKVEIGGETRDLLLDWPADSVPIAHMDSKGELTHVSLPPEVAQVIEDALCELDQTQFGGQAHRESLE